VGGTKLSKGTIADWFNLCREVCMVSMDDRYRSMGKIGGPGHVVEIDECKIGRRKYHRGRIVEGNWILGMIDRNTKEVRMAVCPGNQRDADTLYRLISDHVEISSTIHTDCWRGYNGLMVRGFAAHLTVNHSYHFVDPVTGVHTNTIESQWRSFRRRLSRGVFEKMTLNCTLPNIFGEGIARAATQTLSTNSWTIFEQCILRREFINFNFFVY